MENVMEKVNQVYDMINNVNGKDLSEELLKYKSEIVNIYNLYNRYFKDVGATLSTNQSLSNKEQLEDLIARRYEFALDLDGTFLKENEIEEVLGKIASIKVKSSTEDSPKTTMPKEERNTRNETEEVLDKIASDRVASSEKNNPESTMSKEEKNKRLKLYGNSINLIRREKESVEKALESYNKNKSMDLMIDVKMKLWYTENLLEISSNIAKKLSENGTVQSREEFLQTLRSSQPYEQLNQIYEQLRTQEKRDELKPETYVRNNMADDTEFDVISDETIKSILDKEESYLSEYKNNLSAMESNPDVAEEKQLAQNQNHDYAWGIVLTDPKKIITNQVVDSPTFKGTISVENLGAFAEYSLFRKRQYERENQVKLRERAKISEKLEKIVKKLTQKGSDDEKYESKTMRQYYYEASKTLYNNILRVTKTDRQGKTSESIIFSPIEYTELGSSKLTEFINNVYLSDYMLDVAKKNGGYAGRIIKNADGYLVSNKYNSEEIASAILFQSGQEGNILDHRKGNNKKYTNVKKENFLELIKPKQIER
jgi:hypothetical protein